MQSKTESFLRDRGILSDGRQIDLDELPVPDSIKNKISGGVADYSGKTAEIYNNFVVETVSGIIFFGYSLHCDVCSIACIGRSNRNTA